MVTFTASAHAYITLSSSAIIHRTRKMSALAFFTSNTNANPHINIAKGFTNLTISAKISRNYNFSASGTNTLNTFAHLRDQNEILAKASSTSTSQADAVIELNWLTGDYNYWNVSSNATNSIVGDDGHQVFYQYGQKEGSWHSWVDASRYIVQNYGSWKLRARFGNGDYSYCAFEVMVNESQDYRIYLEIRNASISLKYWNGTTIITIIDSITIDTGTDYHNYEVTRQDDDWTILMDDSVLGTGVQAITWSSMAIHLKPGCEVDGYRNVFYDKITLRYLINELSILATGSSHLTTHAHPRLDDIDASPVVVEAPVGEADNEATDEFWAYIHNKEQYRITAVFYELIKQQYRITACIDRIYDQFRITANIIQELKDNYRITVEILTPVGQFNEGESKWRITSTINSVTKSQWRITFTIGFAYYSIEIHGTIIPNQSERKNEDKTVTNLGVIGGSTIVI